MFFKEEFADVRIYSINEEDNKTDWCIMVRNDQKSETYELWLFNNAYGVMEYVHALRKCDFDYKFKMFITDSIDYVKDNIISLTDGFRKEYMD